MSCALQKDLKSKFSVNSIPIKRDDEVKIMRGSFKGREGKVLSVYRRRWCIYIDKIVKDKVNGQQVQIPIDPSNCVITKIKMDKDRKELLERKKLVKKDL